MKLKIRTVLKIIIALLLVSAPIVAFTPVAVSTYWDSSTAHQIDSTLKSSGDAIENWVANLTSSNELNRSRLEHLIHKEINERRRNHRLAPLDFDPTLRNIARSHSKDMAVNNYFAHKAPNGSTFKDRYRQFGYECRVSTEGSTYYTGAENILYTYYQTEIDKRGDSYYNTPQDLAEGIVNSWMNSSGHRKNILRPYWNNEGIGVYIENTEEGKRVYVTQNFC